MSKKSSEIHEVYEQCKEIFAPSTDLFDEVSNISDKDEKMFYEILTNFFLQQKQKEIVKRGVF